MADLRQEIVMISGGSRGIGYAIAERLGREGARISLCARDDAPLEEARRQLQNQGVSVMAVSADVTCEEEVEHWFQKTEQTFGPAAILVNNAGVSGAGPFLSLTEAEWDHTFAVNCQGVFLCTRRALPTMMQQKRGRILMLSSVASKYYRRDYSLYFASKWALNGFAHSLAKEVHEHGVHVYLLCPGMVETDFFENMGGRPHPVEVPYAEPDTFADLALYLCQLPDTLDTQEICLFPSWQIHQFGIRR